LKTFQSQINDIEPPLQTLDKTIDWLLDSKEIRLLFSVILRIGNYLNGGSSRGGCYGFRIDTLTKLDDLRSNKPGYTLTTYIADVMETEYKDGCDVSNLESMIKLCMRIDLDPLSKLLSNLDST
jgi:hypothetical protein